MDCHDPNENDYLDVKGRLESYCLGILTKIRKWIGQNVQRILRLDFKFKFHQETRGKFKRRKGKEEKMVKEYKIFLDV